MSVKIIEINHSLDNKDDFTSNVIEYSDFRSYVEGLHLNDTLAFNIHLQRVEVLYKHPTGGIGIHQAWVVTT